MSFVRDTNREQARIIQEEIKRIRKDQYLKNRNGLQKLRDALTPYIQSFLVASSIHGLNHLVASKRHLMERIMWLNMIILSIYFTISLSSTTWHRYQYSPTVVSMDRDMFAWNTSFPSVTICPIKKYDEKKLKAYLQSSAAPDKKKLEHFITALANASFNNFQAVPEYEHIPPEDYMELILNLSMNFNPMLTVGASGVTLAIEPTITEMGFCYAINSRIAVYNSPKYRAANRWDPAYTLNFTFSVHPLDGEVFAQVINLSTPYDVYAHGSWEVPDISTKHHHSAEDYYLKLYFTALSVITSPEAAKLSVAQKKCRSPQENNLQHNAIYSYTMCRMECRIKLCLEYCQCIPHFYRPVGDDKICDVKGLHCLSKYYYVLFKLEQENGTRVNCGCLPLCDDVNYVIQSNVLNLWFLGTNFQWGIITYPRMRVRRDIIFGFTDVLVAVGSMAGLFLGCSVLSFMELVYFLTLRLLCYNAGYDNY